MDKDGNQVHLVLVLVQVHLVLALAPHPDHWHPPLPRLDLHERANFLHSQVCVEAGSDS